jgi:hypothetical protein
LDKLLLPPFVLLLLLFHHLLLRDEELGWMDDGTDDGTDGWKGRPPPSQPDKTKDIIYKDVKQVTAGSQMCNPLPALL